MAPPEYRAAIPRSLHPVPGPLAPASTLPEAETSPSRVPTLVSQAMEARLAPPGETVPHPAAVEAAPIVRVSIGSIEVRAPAVAPPPARPASRLMALDDYLRGDVGGRR